MMKCQEAREDKVLPCQEVYVWYNFLHAALRCLSVAYDIVHLSYGQLQRNAASKKLWRKAQFWKRLSLLIL